MNIQEIKAAATAIYATKGLHGVYSLLRKEGVAFETVVSEFGWEGNKSSQEQKSEFMNPDNLRFHYYSVGVRASTGYHCNMLRGIEVVLTMPE